MSSAERLSIDDVDRKILSELMRDCRRSYRSIARRTGVSVGTALNRIRRLEKSGVIKGYSALLDHEKLGYQLTVLAEITVSKGKLLEMEQAINYSNVLRAHISAPDMKEDVGLLESLSHLIRGIAK